jgi:hypothetical protein
VYLYFKHGSRVFLNYLMLNRFSVISFSFVFMSPSLSIFYFRTLFSFSSFLSHFSFLLFLFVFPVIGF